MKIMRNIEDMRTIANSIVIAAGTFDGIHRGHQAVISTAVKQARNKSGQAWVLTFDTHPRKVLDEGDQSLLLTSLSHKLRLIEDMDVDGCVLLPFTPALRRLAPTEFIDKLLASIPALAGVVVGANWRFGRGGAGDTDLLAALGAEKGFAATVVKPVLAGGQAISSTRVRNAVSKGNLAVAREMLGRPFSVLGRVVPGRRIGRHLGYPTANIETGVEIEPPPGIYAVYARINGKRHDGVAYYGGRPTFEDESHELVLEVHIFDGSFDLYSQEMEISFIEHIRPDRRFASRQELIAAIEDDCRAARAILDRDDNAQTAGRDRGSE